MGIGDTMSGHTDAVYRTTKARPCSVRASSGIGVAHPHIAVDFMLLPHADWPLASYLELGALPTAPACARNHTHAVLKEWGLGDPDFIATAELLVSELVTNAYEATVRRQLDTPIALRLSSNDRQILIEVWDADPTPPQSPTLDGDGLPSPAAESGRGLFLIAALSERWGCYRRNAKAGGGKVVWAEVGS